MLKSDSGNDTMVGGDGEDVFRFMFNFGHDVIRDFESEDTLHLLAPTGFTSLSDFEWEQTDLGAKIHVSEDSSITLKGESVEWLGDVDAYLFWV